MLRHWRNELRAVGVAPERRENWVRTRVRYKEQIGENEKTLGKVKIF